VANFPYDNSVPAANDDPSDDQPVMLSNVEQSELIWDVDHVGFNADNGGTHLQTTFSSKNTPGAQTDPQSVLYTASGTASSVADLFYKNQNATFRPNAIKAAGRIQCRANAGAATVVANASFNVVSAVQGATSASQTGISITLTTNAVVGTVAIPVVSLELAGIVGWVVSSSISGNVLSLNIFRSVGLGTDVFINFAILQV
jgi:hypothetical protein